MSYDYYKILVVLTTTGGDTTKPTVMRSEVIGFQLREDANIAVTAIESTFPKSAVYATVTKLY